MNANGFPAQLDLWICDFHLRVVTVIVTGHGYSHMVPACACASNTIIEASSRLMLVDRCERAAICTSSSNTSSSSSGVRSCELYRGEPECV